MEKILNDYVELVATKKQHYDDGLITIEEAIYGIMVASEKLLAMPDPRDSQPEGPKLISC